MRYEEFINVELGRMKKAGWIRTEHIPDLALYVDQVETFFNSELEALDDDEIRRNVSKPLINNYTKRGLIAKPEGKRYTGDHMIMIAMVLYLKGLFKLEKIEKLMKPLVDNYQSAYDEKIDPAILYEEACKINANAQDDFAARVDRDIESIKKHLEDTDVADDERMEIFILILSLTMRAYLEKKLAMSLIEEYFVDPDREKPDKVRPDRIRKKNRNAEDGEEEEVEE